MKRMKRVNRAKRPGRTDPGRMRNCAALHDGAWARAYSGMILPGSEWQGGV